LFEYAAEFASQHRVRDRSGRSPGAAARSGPGADAAIWRDRSGPRPGNRHGFSGVVQLRHMPYAYTWPSRSRRRCNCPGVGAVQFRSLTVAVTKVLALAAAGVNTLLAYLVFLVS